MLQVQDTKFIYIRVTKTGSTSLKYCLPNITWDLTGWEGDPNHVPLWFFEKNLSKDVYDSHFKFSFVRNPWDRLVSSYIYTKKWYRQNAPAKFDDARLYDFKSWILTINSNHKYGMQYDFVNGCDFIGRFENFQEDFNIVCDKIGIPKQELPHKNKIKHKHYTEHYDDETKQIVAEKYAKDIEYFGYEFGE
jgi:chondroitin 4-sulfotransferase 11